MKNIIITVSFVACLFICLSYTTTFKKTSGSHPGSTGAPLDQTCAQSGCHTDAQITYNAVNNNTLIFSSLDSSYVPGGTYNLTVQVQASVPTTKFGFEIGVLKDSDSLNVGQFQITDINPLRTQIITHSVGSDMRYSVTHKTAGTAATSTNFNRWTFSWTAPPVNEGTITFYYCTNCTNSDNQATGDQIYLHKFQIHPANTTSVKELAEDFDVKSYFDKQNNEVLLSYDLKGKRNVQVFLFDIAGKVVYHGPPSKLSGKQSQRITLDPDHVKGTYLVQIQIDNHRATKKFIVN